MSAVEDSLASLKADVASWLHRLQHGSDPQSQDPVFEGMVRDLLQYDATLQALERGVRVYMEGVEGLCQGLEQLSEAAVLGLTKRSDSCICRDVCRYRESIHRISRADAPHAALSRLKRDLAFNVLEPLRKHREHNKQLKQQFQLRRRRLAELIIAKRHLERIHQQHLDKEQPHHAEAERCSGNGADGEDCAEEQGLMDGIIRGNRVVGVPPKGSCVPQSSSLGVSASLSRALQDHQRSGCYDGATAAAAEAAASAYTSFKQVDDVLFEWLQVLECYRCDIFDSLLQTLKYLQYEFFAGAAHAVNSVLPKRMEFRPMVEMTPQQLLPLVELELEARANSPPVDPSSFSFGSGGGVSATERLLDRWEREAAADAAAVAPASSSAPTGSSPTHLPAVETAAADVDILSLAVLTGQGFGEKESRLALLRFGNDTQAALEWLLDGGASLLLEQAAPQERKQEQQQGSDNSNSSLVAGSGSGGAAATTAAVAAAAMAASGELDEVRLPTTLKWVQKLKEARRKEILAWKQRRAERDAEREVASGDAGGSAAGPSGSRRSSGGAQGRGGGRRPVARDGNISAKERHTVRGRMHSGHHIPDLQRSTTGSRAQCEAVESQEDAKCDAPAHSGDCNGKGSDESASGGIFPCAAALPESSITESSEPKGPPEVPDVDERATRVESSGGVDLLSLSPEGAPVAAENTAAVGAPGISLLDLEEDATSFGSDLKTLPLPGLLGSFDASKCAWSREKENERLVKEETLALRQRLQREAEADRDQGQQKQQKQSIQMPACAKFTLYYYLE
ncbi:uncharacterized protein LOC34618921 [Cyclospora cayetanensis]|uniref:Uncharacterized protein LOC34618921 n=1 Tax=Cyclospora cayetanensis TaxID=88456 RepID=A0A6P6S081_9EIME|nr:uncharacterized protein LOC34618921 [Cyclospora cayetanensis]